jgi:hypothetical protein
MTSTTRYARIRLGFAFGFAASLLFLAASARADVAERAEALMKTLPRRPCRTGKGMPSKLGVLYLMGAIESQGMYDLADSGNLPIIKTGGVTPDRAWRAIQHNPDIIWVCSAGAPLNWKEETPKKGADRMEAAVREEFRRIPQPWQHRVDFIEMAPCMWEPTSPEQAVWYSEYLCELLPRVADLGPRPIVLNSGVGGLPIDGKILKPMAPGLRLAHHLGGAWGCHGYSNEYTMDEHTESWFSLRYRQAYNFFREHHPELMDFPMILLEGGIDKLGDPDKDGWMARGSLKKFTDWLTWYDDQLRRDDYVLGVTLFKIGAPSTWRSFELEPVVPWLLDHYRALLSASPESKPKAEEHQSSDQSSDPEVYIRWAPSSGSKKKE